MYIWVSEMVRIKNHYVMKRVINFSGGRTSALMTILLNPTENDIVLFCDTGREVAGTYKFVDDFERNEGIKVHRAIYTNRNAPGLTAYDALMKNRKRTPNVMERFCTERLKVLMAKRYLRLMGIRNYENFIGFRADEPTRVTEYKNYIPKAIPKFPLYDKGITKPNVLQYWKFKPYDLEIPPILGNCDLCFLKGKDAIIKILSVYPELADKWIKDEHHGTYIKGTSYAQLLAIAKSRGREYGLEDIQPAYNCSCTSM